MWAFVETDAGTAAWGSPCFPLPLRCHFFHSMSHFGCLQEAAGGARRMGGRAYGAPEVACGGWHKAGPRRGPTPGHRC